MSDCSTHAFDVPLKGMLTAEQVRGVLLLHLPHREYYSIEQTDAWQAIADELNSRAEMSYEDALILLDELGVSERTCKFVSSKGSDYPPVCSACGYELGIYDCAWYEDGTYGYERNYCPNCGAKVVE